MLVVRWPDIFHFLENKFTPAGLKWIVANKDESEDQLRPHDHNASERWQVVMEKRSESV